MNWVVGQRVHREGTPDQVGTVADVKATEIKIVWDDGGVSFHEINSAHSLRPATKSPWQEVSGKAAQRR
jgi:hypothetical protein